MSAEKNPVDTIRGYFRSNPQDLEKAAMEISRLPENVTNLDLSNCTIDSLEAIRVLKNIPATVKTLNLKGNPIATIQKEDGSRRLGKLAFNVLFSNLAGKQITHLNLSGTNFGLGYADDWSKADEIKKLPKNVTNLNLSNNHITNKDRVKDLQKMLTPNVKIMDLSLNSIPDECTIDIQNLQNTYPNIFLNVTRTYLSEENQKAIHTKSLEQFQFIKNGSKVPSLVYLAMLAVAENQDKLKANFNEEGHAIDLSPNHDRLLPSELEEKLAGTRSSFGIQQPEPTFANGDDAPKRSSSNGLREFSSTVKSPSQILAEKNTPPASPVVEKKKPEGKNFAKELEKTRIYFHQENAEDYRIRKLKKGKEAELQENTNGLFEVKIFRRISQLS